MRSFTNSLVHGGGAGSRSNVLTRFVGWFSIWFSGVLQCMGQWKLSSSHGILRALTIFATAGQGDTSCSMVEDLVKVIPLYSRALKIILSGLLLGSGSDD